MNNINNWPRQRGGSYIDGLHDLCQFLIGECPDITTMAEIGSFAGESASIFIQYFKIVNCVDIWEPILIVNGVISNIISKKDEPNIYTNAEKNFDMLFGSNKNIIKIKDRSENACKRFENNSLDFVYIDADHSYESVQQDIVFWLPKVKKNMFFGGHDYSSSFVGVVKAVNEKFIKPYKVFRDNSWIVKLC